MFLSGVCSGDSGGPLLRRLADDRFVLLGIVSRGTQPTFCGGRDTVTHYVRVKSFVQWISSVVDSIHPAAAKRKKAARAREASTVGKIALRQRDLSELVWFDKNIFINIHVTYRARLRG